MRNDFAVFILSHGRAETVITAKTLEKQGYSGSWYIVIDNEDEKQGEYKKAYGERVIVFDKKEAARTTDTLDNFRERNVVVFARNQVNEIAKQRGFKHYLVLDDDYDRIVFRYAKGKILHEQKILQIEKVFEVYIRFLEVTNAVTVAFAQNGDFIGGVNSGVFKRGITRKAMNSFFCRADKPLKFYGRINEDVTMYSLAGIRGELVFTTTHVAISQTETQQNQGGLTDAYLELGTYIKSFYSVIACPSCVKVAMLKSGIDRLHHNVNWKYCAVKILNERLKKPSSRDSV